MSKGDPEFTRTDPARLDFQYLENLATGYWYSESLFAAVELRLFHHIETGTRDTQGLARAANCRLSPLARLMGVLAGMDLVGRFNGLWFNNPLAKRYLLPDQPDYMGDFLLYRRYLQPRWQGLAEHVAAPGTPLPRLSVEDDYERRNYHYVMAVDRLARLKAREIEAVLEGLAWSGPILDVGGGAGALSRCLIQDRPEETAVLLELPEVLAAARRLYPSKLHWDRLHGVACDFRFASPFGANRHFGMILMSNFMHAYGPVDAEKMLARTVKMLKPGGIMLIHDYFPDVAAGPSSRGGLHDVNMMLNTLDGVCHPSEKVIDWLFGSGLGSYHVIPLSSDSAVILARQNKFPLSAVSRRQAMVQKAGKIGFQKVVRLNSALIKTAPWVQVKCRFGCAHFGSSLQCPPHTRTEVQTGQLLATYGEALLLVGQPPGNAFHRRLLELEKEAFLSGFHKALAFGAGPCTLCRTCDTGKPCRFPELARPSMEASGMDVYETARRCGLTLEPVAASDGYVKYIGLLLLE
jgi:predicted metal-binding protein/SAM-dependent methyltransferase